MLRETNLTIGRGDEDALVKWANDQFQVFASELNDHDAQLVKLTKYIEKMQKKALVKRCFALTIGTGLAMSLLLKVLRDKLEKKAEEAEARYGDDTDEDGGEMI
jgi:hypothetical protein